jgi:hypothetical protein
MVQVEVEVFDAPLDYNLLLGHSWIDSMRAGAYELVDYDGIPLSEPRNGLYLKKYYA